MKYNVGDRFRYFSIVGWVKRPNMKFDSFEALCDCGKFFNFPTNKIYDREYKTCSSRSSCSVYVDLNNNGRNWPVDIDRRRDIRSVFTRPLKEKFKKVVYKTCKTCNKKKVSLFFNQEMQHTCLSCLDGKTPEEFRAQANRRSNQKRKRVVVKLVGSHKDKRGFVYLMYSKSINMYKVGKSKSPLARLDNVRLEYGLLDLKILCIGNPLGDAYRVESHIQNKIKTHKVDRLKPNGGFTNELFSCSLLIASSIFIESMQEVIWLDDSTRDLIDINIPKISKDIISKRYNRKKYKAV